MDELDIMRQQLDAMKSLLNTQQIVTDKLLRTVMQGKWSWANKLVAGEIIILPFIYLMLAVICAGMHLSQWYAVSFLLLASIDTAVDWRTIRVPRHMFSEASIVELKKFMLRQKKERALQYCISIPATVIWFSLFMFGMYSNINLGNKDIDAQGVLYAGIIGSSIGLVCGMLVVVVLIRKIERDSNRILKDIHALENDEE